MSRTVISPSNASRAINCPGSIILSENIQDTSTKFSSAGVQTHAYAAMKLSILLGHKIDSVNISNPELIDYFCADFYVNDIIKQVGTYTKVFIEKTVEIFDGIKGTPDCVLINKKTLRIIDLKTGAMAVSARNNQQLLLYAAYYLKNYDIDHVFLDIIQPPLDVTETVYFTAANAMKELDSLKLEIEKAQSDIIEYKQSKIKIDGLLKDGSWCQFCPAFHFCKIQHEKFIKIKDSLSPSLSNSENYELAKDILRDAPDVIKYIKSIKAFLFSELESGAEINGLKLVEKKSRRKWKIDSEEKLIDMLKDNWGGLVAGEIFDKKLKSPSQLETLIREKVGIKLVEAKKFVSDFTIKESSGKKMVKDFDNDDSDEFELDDF